MLADWLPSGIAANQALCQGDGVGPSHTKCTSHCVACCISALDGQDLLTEED